MALALRTQKEAAPAGSEFSFRPICAELAASCAELTNYYEDMFAEGSGEEKEAAACIASAEKCLYAEDVNGASKAASRAADLFRQLDRQACLADALHIMIACRCHEERLGAAPARGSSERRSVFMALQEHKRLSQAGEREGAGMMLLAAAEASFDESGPDEGRRALQMAKEARDIFRDSKNLLKEVRALGTLIDMHVQRQGGTKEGGREAQQLAKDALILCTQCGCKKGEAMVLHGQAGAHALRGAFDQACKSAKQAAGLFQSLEIPRLQALALENLARLHLQAGEPQKALQPAEQGLGVAERAPGAASREADLLAAVADAQLARGMGAKALDVAERALKRFQVAGAKHAEAKALHVLAKLYIAKSSPTGGLRLAEEAASLARDLGDRRAEGAALRLASRAHAAEGRTDRAVSVAEQAVTVAKESWDPAEHAASLRTLSQAHIAGGAMAEAAEAVSREGTVLRQAGRSLGEALSLLHACEVHTATGDYDKVVSCATDAQALLHKIGDSKREAKAWHEIAQAQLSGEKHGPALWAAERAKKLHQEFGDTTAHVEACLVAAQAHFGQALRNQDRSGAQEESMKMVQLALNEGQEAVALARRTEDQKLVATALCTLAQAETVAMLWPEALKSATEAVELHRELGDEFGEASATVMCAHVHLLCDRPGRAGKAATEAMLIFQRLGDFQAEAWAAGIFEHLGAGARSLPPAMPLAKGRRAAPTPGVGSGMGLAKQLAALDEAEVEFDTPLMQPGAMSSPALRSQLARLIVEERTDVPRLFSG